MASFNSNSSTESLKESVLKNLRSVTQSRKGGVPLNSLERDYRDLLGTSIPFRDLGYSSLVSFLKDIPKVIELINKDGQMYVEGKADDSTAHIVSLVNRQKAAPTKPRANKRPHIVHRRGGFNPRYSYRGVKPSPRYQAASHTENKHSKPVQSALRETSKPVNHKPKSPDPPPPRVSHTASKKFIAPRFLRLQQRKQDGVNQENTAQTSPVNSFRPKTPPLPVESPEPYLRPVENNNNFIRSPKPLLTRTIVNDKAIDLNSTASAKEYVKKYALMKNLTISYTTRSIGQKKYNKSFISSLCLGGKKYHSYPEQASTEAEAEELAAKNAVKFIQESEEHLASCPETTIRNSEDVQILINRIEEIVCEKPSGMFTNGIVHEYENKYNETLPENWLKLLQQSAVLEIEDLDVRYGRVPKGVSSIVRRAKIPSGCTTPSSTSEGEKSDVGHGNIVPKNIVRKDHLPNTPELKVPDGNEWAVFITDVSKTVAARLIEYDDLFLTMLEEMKKFYSSESLPALEIREGLLYAAHDSDGDIFHRVLVQRIKENVMAECYFVDEGVFSDVLQSDLQELHNDFWKLPYQAIHLTLDGFEEYVIRPDDLECILKLSYIALVKRWTTTVDDYFPEDPAVHKIIYSVELYDTTGLDDINMNKLIKDNIIETYIPTLPVPSVSDSGYYLTHVEDTGEIFLRKLPPLESWLETSLDGLSSNFEDGCLENATVPYDKMCVAKYEDGKWYRALPLRSPALSTDPEQVTVFFVDYGNTSTVSVKEICNLERYSDFLSRLKPQAIKCELFNPLPSPDVEWTPEAAIKLMELAPLTDELLIRVIAESDGNTLPKVNLYKRTYQNGDSFIISINESLANKPELFKKTLHKPDTLLLQNSLKSNIRPPVPKIPYSNFNSIKPAEETVNLSIKPPSPVNEHVLKWAITPDNIKSPDAFDNQELPPLLPPKVPETGTFFDVFVTMAANPFNFYVQPYETVKDMTDLMCQMQNFYNYEENQIDMPISLLKKNGFYAVKHKDDSWYRAQLQEIISKDPIEVIVKYVDFGDIVTVRNMQHIQSLFTSFRQLPCQGIKAALAGVKPIERDWMFTHCWEFKQAVEEKKFVSLIQEKITEPTLELKLTLIDVSDPKDDVYINELLIKKGIAERL